MDLVEKQRADHSPAWARKHLHCRANWQRLQRFVRWRREFANYTSAWVSFWLKQKNPVRKVSTHLNDILFAQDYQGLTGQVIKRVTTLVP